MSAKASSISKNLKTKSAVHSQRLALESRLVFDGAIAVTAVDAQATIIDQRVVDTASHATPPSEPTVAFAPLEKTAIVVDYQPNADMTVHQTALPVEPKNPIDAINLALSPVTDISIGSVSTATTLIIVDPRVSNAADLVANPPAHAQVFTLDTTRDGFQQVVDLLQGRHDVTQLDVLSWTDSHNTQWLGNKSLTATLEPVVGNELIQWGDGFANNATIVFHGSNNLGASWLSHIDALTGADTDWSQDTNLGSQASSNSVPTHELIVVDTSIKDYLSLLSAVNPNTEILYLDHSKDGITQIAAALNGRSDISSLQILSHGSDGTLILGSTVLDNATLELYKTQLAEIGHALTDKGDILLYGCDVANGAAGIAFINRLAALTNADVAASTDATGNAIKGGDWVLESATGLIESAYLTPIGYDGLLAAPVIGGATAGQTVNDNVSNTPFAAVTITDADIGNLQTLIITLDNAAKGSLSNLSGGTFVAGVYTLSGVDAATAQAAIHALVFTPSANRVVPTLTETTAFTISVNDGTTTITDSATTVISTSINDAPIAVVDTNNIVEKSVSVIGNVLTNDTDVDIGDTKTVTALTSGTVGIALVGTYGSLLLNADGSYTYTLDNTNAAVQALGSASVPLSDVFTYTMKDTAGATASASLNVSITGLNDQPVLTVAPVALTQVEDTSTAFTVGNLLTNASNVAIWSDTDVGTAMGIAITAAPSTDAISSMTGTWKYSLDSGSSWVNFPVVSATSALLLPSTAQVQFFATHNASIDSQNSGTVSLTYTAWDASSGIAGGTANTTAPTSTSAFSTASNTAVLNVTPFNNAPVFSSTGLAVNEHTTVNLSGSYTDNSTLIAGLTGNLKIYDPDNTTAQILYRIEELPTKGTLTLNGAVLNVGSLFSQVNVASIVYTPTVGELAADTTDRFYFTIRDGAGGVIGADGKTGANPWAFLDITIKDVNAQVAVSGTTLAIAENNLAPNIPVIAPVALSMSDADDPTGLRTLTLTSLPTATFGTLQYWNGSIYADVTPAMVNVLTFTQAQLTDPVHPALQFVYNNATEPTDGNGVLIPAQSQTSFTVHINDNNTHLPVTTADSTVTINITPSNDPPVLVTNGLTVVQDSTANIINTTNLITTDPDSPVSGRTYTVSIDPALGYLTLNGVRIGRGATFTEADLTSGQLQYNSNLYTYGNDSLQVIVTDGNGGSSGIKTLGITISFVNPNTGNIILNPTFGTNAAGNPTITDPSTGGTFDLAVPPVGSGTPVGGNTASITGTFKGISPEGLFLKLDNTMLKDVGTGPTTTVFTVTQPAHGKVYLNGIELVYGTTTFTQGDINLGNVVYVHDSSEANAYAFTDTLNITANKGGSTISHDFTITITPVDDAPTITQVNYSYNTNEAGGLLMEQNADGSNGIATALIDLSNVTNAKKLTINDFQWNDIDNTRSQLTYMASAVNGTIATWNTTTLKWEAITGSFTADQLAAGDVAYFHDPAADVATPNTSSTINSTMTGSVSVYLIDGATVSAGNVQISPPNITELGTLTVTDVNGINSQTITLTKGSQMVSPTRTVTFTATNVNDAPVASNSSFTVTEFSAGIPAQANHIQILNTSIVSASDSDTGNSTWTYALTVLPTDGRIEISNDNFVTVTTMAVGNTFTYAQLAAGNLRYVNTGRLEVTVGLNWNSAQDSFKFKVNDGELISNQKPLDSNEATVSIFLRPTNQPPVVVHTGPVSIPEGGTLNITSTLLGSENVANSADIVAVVDSDNTRVQVQYRITANVGHGILYLGDPVTGAVTKQLSVGSAFTLEDIQLGKVWYLHNGTESAPYNNKDFFDYVISDASGMNEPAAQFVINFDAAKSVNDPPIVTGLVGGATFTEGGTIALPNVSPILIDSSVVLTDPDLANNNLDFRGGSLELTYATGGSNVTSLFDQLAIKNIGGAGQIGVFGDTITYDGVTIASIDTTKNGQNGAALKIIFDTNANTSLTIPAVRALIEAVTFAHTEYDNAVTGVRTLNYTLIDGGGTASFTLNGITVTGLDTWTGSATVIVAPANDRPIITTNTSGGNLPLGTITEDDTTTPLTFQVSSFTTATNGTLPDGTHTGIVDVDTGAVRGIAVTGLTSAATGHWEYSTNGTVWTTITNTTSPTQALLLLPTDSIRFVPDGKNGGIATITYKAWDTTFGNAHAYVNSMITDAFQTSAFSTATDTAQITVTPINDAPVLADTVLSLINEFEDAGAPSGAVGTLVSTLVGGLSDVDTGALKGIAITAANATNGTWYFTTDGGTNWIPLGTPTVGSAVLLASDSNTRVYFQPNADYNGVQATALTVRAWDQTTGSNGATVDTTSSGGITAFSSATDTVSLTVTALNDAPTISNSTPIINATGLANENTQIALGSIFTLGDIDLARFEGTNTGQITLSVPHGAFVLTTTGITVTAGTQATDRGAGNWGGGTNILTFTGTLAQLQTALNTVIYVPGDDPNTSETITVTLNDLNNAGLGSASGGSDIHSVSTTVDINLITPVNDAPTLTRPATVTAIEDTQFSFTGGNLISIADVDARNGLVEVALSIPKGAITLILSGATSVFSGLLGSSAFTLHGTITDINASLATLKYTAALDNNTLNTSAVDRTLTINVSDLGNSIGGATTTAATATATTVIAVTPVNDTPTLDVDLLTAGNQTTRATTTVLETATTSITDIVLADSKDINDTGYAATTNVVITALHGTLSLTAFAGVTAVPSGRTITLTGTIADINAAIAAGNFKYTPDTNFSGNDTLSLVFHDAGNSGTTFVDLTASGTIPLLVNGVNDAPSFSALGGGSVAVPDVIFAENGTAVVLDANATISDPELSVYNNWGGAILTIQRTATTGNVGVIGDDVFTLTGSLGVGVDFNLTNVRINGTAVGTFTNTNGVLTITFNNAITTAQVNLVLQAVKYNNTNDNPPTSVTLGYTINDGNTNTGATAQGAANPTLALIGSGQVIVGITAVNDPPLLPVFVNTASYTEDATPTVLNPTLTLSDPELSFFTAGAGNWGNATLTISSSGVASATGVFSASGTLSALTVGTNLLVDNGVTLGTVTTNSAGTLKLTFNDAITTAQVQAALRQLAYSNTIQSLAALATSPVTLNWVLDDGNTNSGTNPQGTGGNLSVTKPQTVTLTGINDAPVLTDTVLSITQIEDAIAPVGAVGTLVSTLIGGISDADTLPSANPKGIAITATDSTNGTWYYSTNNGTNWTAFTAINTTARLLAADANTRVYFKPTADWQGTSITSGLTIRAWDGSTTGANGGIAAQDLSIGGNVGGTTAFSSAIDVVAVTVTPVNDQPTASTDVTLPAYTEDVFTPNGTLISGLAFGYSDVIDNQTGNGGGDTSTPFSYIAIVGSTNYIATQGSWQVSTSVAPDATVATDWITIPTSGLATTTALIFASDRQIRFVPAADFHGTPGTLQVRLADNNVNLTGTGTTSSNATTLFNLATVANGGTGTTDAWNAVSRTISTTVIAVNDAPTFSGNTTFTATNKDTTSTTRTAANIATSLIYGDVKDNQTAITGGGNTATAQKALAIVGNAATAAQGTWQYTTDGSTWIAISTGVADTTAVVLNLANANHQIRFVPFGDYNGTAGNLTLRAADGTWNTLTGIQDISSVIGTTNPWSIGTATLGISVNPVNDAPTINNLDATPTFIEGIDTAGNRTVIGTPVILDASVHIGDIEIVTRNEDNFGGTTLTIARDNGTGLTPNTQDIFGIDTSGTVTLATNVISVSGIAVADITTNTGGQLIITFRSSVTSTQVDTVIGAITYANNSDTPPITATLRYHFNDDNQSSAQGSGGSLTGDAIIIVNITAQNDMPLAIDDTHVIVENTATISGNVLTGIGSPNTTADSDPENNVLTVTAIRTGTEVAGSGTSGTVDGITLLTGSHGTLKIAANGSYTYALNNNDPAVNQLKTGQSITDTFSYTLSDGSLTDIAQLTITINGVTDGTPTIVSVDGTTGITGETTVYESGLTSDAPVGQSKTGTGTLTLTALDGLASITIDGSAAIDVARLTTLSTTNLVINTPKGVLTLTNFTATTSVGGVPTVGILTYSYTLSATQTVVGTDSTDVIPLTITDAAAVTTTGNNLTIQIVDDVPTAKADTHSVTEGINIITPSLTTGNVFNGTTGGDVADRQGADIRINPVIAVIAGNTTPTTTVVAGSTSVLGGTLVTGNYGTLTIGADGSYSYTLDNTKPAVNALNDTSTPLTDTFSYQITDNDGDTGITTLTITINGKTDGVPTIVPVDGTTGITGETTVYESGLTSDASVGQSKTGTGTLTLTALDGLTSITIEGSAAIDVARLTTLSTTNLVINTPKGVLTLTNFTATTSVGGVPTVGILTYSYTLSATQTVVGTDSTDVIPLTITDAAAVTTTGNNLTIQIIDDVPTAKADTHSVIEKANDITTSITTGNVFNGTTGGDVADRQGADTRINPVIGVIVGNNTPTNNVPINTNSTTGTSVTGNYGTLTIGSDGSYSYALDNTNAMVNKLLTTETLLETYSYTITDADGDTSTTTLIITINGVTDGEPSITPVDGNDAAVTGQAEVYEKGLINVADTSETTSGTLTITAPDGMASVTIGGTIFTVAQLATFTTLLPSAGIDTVEGTLTVTGFTITAGIASAPTAATLSYSYTLNTTQAHTGGAAVTESVDNIALIVTDASSSATQSTGTLTVRIVDDVPTAKADTHSVTEKANDITTSITTGNVFNGTTGGDVADRQGADTRIDPVIGIIAGNATPTNNVITGTNSTTGISVIGSYGTLTIGSDGSYSYALDNTNVSVNKLLTGQSLLDTYSYTITDADGDTSTTTLTITINGVTDGTPSIIPFDGNTAGATGEATVYESGLTSDSPVGQSKTATGTMTVTALDGLTSITVGGTAINLATLAGLSGSNLIINTPKGVLTLTNFTADTTVGGVPTVGILSYSYTLSATQTVVGTETTDVIALTVTDAGAVTTTGSNLTIQIVDDTPTANADANSVAEGTTSVATTTTGNVFAAGSSLDKLDRIGADNLPVNPVTAFSFAANNGLLGNALNGAYGSLTLNANGSYSYALDNTNVNVNALLTGETLKETFSYTITDADGDTSTADLVITINGITDSTPEISPVDGNGTEAGEATVFEKGLVAPTDNSQTVTGSINVTAPDGMASVTLGGIKFTVAQLLGFSASSPSVDIDTGEGTIKITGFTVVTGSTTAPLAGSISYSYTLNRQQLHTGVNNSESTDIIDLLVTDASSAGNTATGKLTIRIIDDTPTAKPDTNTVIEGTTTEATTTSGNVFGKTGASIGDVSDRIGADTTATPVTGISFAGNVKSVGSTFNSAYGSLTLNANGSYTYTLDNTNTTVNALSTGQKLTETFSYTVTDADGDSSTTTLTITINGKNDAPIAVNDSSAGVSGQPVMINVLGNDTDSENNINPATVKIVGTANVGDPLVVIGQGIWTVNPTTGAISFTPETGFTGDPTPIKYMVKDTTSLESNQATVTVDYPQTAPTAVNDTTTGVTGRPVTINVLGNDSDSENDLNPATVQLVGTAKQGDPLEVAGQGTWTVNPTTGEIAFTPIASFTDDPTPISYTVQDKTGLISNPAMVFIDYPVSFGGNLGTSGSLIMLTNPDRNYDSGYGNIEEKQWHIENKFRSDNSLPPVHLSLYVPLRHHIISLTGSLRDQVVLELERYSFSVPRWMFRHTDPNEELEFEATRPDGSSLPAWLIFDPKTLTFYGIPPKGTHNERVMVTARDIYGNEVRPTFSVHVNKERVRHSDKPNNNVLEKNRLGEKPVAKSALSEQVQAVGKLSKLRESRALLDSLKQL